MIRTVLAMLRTRCSTTTAMFPEMVPHALVLPTVGAAPCASGDCGRRCVAVCPTDAITVGSGKQPEVTVDRGRCLACGACLDGCPSGTLRPDRRSAVAVRSREELVHSNRPTPTAEARPTARGPFQRSLHVREVSAGDSATDMEIQAANNPIHDSARFGIHFVASPRHADALLVTGPVGRAMAEPLRRCHDAMAEPRLVIAAGCAAISGGLHAGGYAEANGVDSILPVDVYIPGNPPHPHMILHGLLLAMGRESSAGSELKP